MIKIIRPGKKRYEATCKVCGCLFSFDESDLEETGPQYDRSVYMYCPFCHEKMTAWDLDDFLNCYK